MDLVSIAFLVGFFGDLLLQLLVKLGLGNWGLQDYFLQHGSIESMCIAGGMLALFYIIYPFKPTLLGLAGYGVILDLIFRIFMIFPSLKGYYLSLNYFWSAFWGIIPMIIPFIIKLKINR